MDTSSTKLQIKKQNINPFILFSIKEGARIEDTLFKAKWEVVPVKLAALPKNNFPFEISFCEFLRSRSFEVLRVASCERLHKASCQSLTKNLMIIPGAHRIVAFEDVLQITKFCKSSRKTPVLETLFNALAGLRPATALKNDFSRGVFV